MDTYVHDGAAWQKAKQIYVHNGLVWRDVCEGWCYDGSAWRQVFQCAPSWTEIRSPALDGVTFTGIHFAVASDGTISIGGVSTPTGAQTVVFTLVAGTWTFTTGVGTNNSVRGLCYLGTNLFVIGDVIFDYSSQLTIRWVGGSSATLFSTGLTMPDNFNMMTSGSNLYFQGANDIRSVTSMSVSPTVIPSTGLYFVTTGYTAIYHDGTDLYAKAYVDSTHTRIFKFNGTAWIPYTGTLAATFGTTKGICAVGGVPYVALRYNSLDRVFKWNGSDYVDTAYPEPVNPTQYYNSMCSDGTYLYVLSNTGRVWRYDGTTWTRAGWIPQSGANGRILYEPTQNALYACGAGKIYRYAL